MESKFKPESICNVFKELSKENSCYLMGLSLASNDLVINLNTFKYYPPTESNCFFSNAISILREIARLIVEINQSTLHQRYSNNTKSIFDKLKTKLVPFHDESFTKATLKPIRDFTFHYDLNKIKANKVIESIFQKMQNSDTIEMGFDPNDESALGQRYLFADSFRANYIDHFLNKNIVTDISTISVDLINFIDSLMYDIIIGVNDENAL